jgi:monoterpene epsilon-lactone hydrolase
MTNSEASYLRELYADWSRRMADDPDMDVATLRDLFEEWHLPTREPQGVSYTDVDAGGVPAIRCVPLGVENRRTVLYMHGGGFVVGSSYSHRKLAAHIAKAAGVTALVLDYRRAPESPFPAQIEDGVRAYEWLLSEGVRGEEIVTCGDSAGGNLAISVALTLRDLGGPMPGAIVAYSPFVDMTISGATMDTLAPLDALVQRPIVTGMAATLLNGQDERNPLASPIFADLTGLPPLLIDVGDHETLLDDSRRLAERARTAGVDVTLHIEPGMQHVYQSLAGRAPEADAAIARTAHWITTKLMRHAPTP